MREFFARHKEDLTRFMNEYLSTSSCHKRKVRPFGRDICREIASFSERGKMIRGGLVALGHYFNSTRGTQDVLKVGTALEIMHSALLIHDDLMDRDLRRRGADSFHQRYRNLAHAQRLKDPDHFGDGMAICGGDIAFFMAMDLLGTLECDQGIRQRIWNLCSREMAYVGTAQMVDLYLGASEEVFDEATILELYRYKTGRYTFSLPLISGLLLAGLDEDTVNAVDRIGEKLGIVFQIKDDELGLFGDEQQTGKPVGSDVREGKKTLYILHLYNRAGPEARSTLSHIIGNPAATMDDVVYVRDMIEKLGIRQELERRVGSMSEKARKMVAALDMANADAVRILLELIDYNSSRLK